MGLPICILSFKKDTAQRTVNYLRSSKEFEQYRHTDHIYFKYKRKG